MIPIRGHASESHLIVILSAAHIIHIKIEINPVNKKYACKINGMEKRSMEKLWFWSGPVTTAAKRAKYSAAQKKTKKKTQAPDVNIQNIHGENATNK